MATPSFTTLVLEGDVAAALAQIPASAGVVQVLDREGRHLLIGRAANLRRWAASRLGAGPPVRKGARPPTDLRPVARAIAWASTASPFHQRLVYERLVAAHVAPQARRGLKTPAFLHLDASERFPRVTVGTLPAGPAGLFGPFRDRRAAERARDALHKLFPLRPCDYTFEPDPALPLGLGCFYAQVRTCAAPCLVRITEETYRGLAREASDLLAHAEGRSEAVASWLPPWVAPAEGSLGLVIERTKDAIELYPVRDGAVLEEHAARTDAAGLTPAVGRLRWTPPDEPRDDTSWLAAWLHARKRGAYLVLEEPNAEALAARVRAALGLER